MKKIMQFSRKKFESLDDERKIRTIVSFIETIYHSWNDTVERKRLLTELYKCLSILQDSPRPELQEIAHLLGDLQHDTREAFMQQTSRFLSSYGNDLSDYDIFRSITYKDRAERKVPLYAVLHNLRSAFNVGSIIRTSECLGISKIYMTGYTPTPANSKVRKTAMSTEERIYWEKREDIFLLLKELRESAGMEVIALETSPESLPLHKTSIKKPAVLLVGNEAFGLPEELLRSADKILEIPLSGWKESLNVGVAYGMACYEILRQWKMIEKEKED